MINMPLEAVVRRRFNHPPERIFRAWVTPSEVCQWFRVDPSATCECVELNASPGGRYSFRMGGSMPARMVSGEYLEVVPPSRLSFTWLWEGHPTEKTTVVTVTLEPAAGSGTDLTIRHSRFPDQNMADQHAKGWNGTLDMLGLHLES